MDKKQDFLGTGRRKSAVARVRIRAGKGNITVNGKDALEYFGSKLYMNLIEEPLALTNNMEKLDIEVKVEGGGISGQAGAVRHGISRALLELDPENRAILKPHGLITRDPREKERKKYGLKKARKAPQFSKR